MLTLLEKYTRPVNERDPLSEQTTAVYSKNVAAGTNCILYFGIFRVASHYCDMPIDNYQLEKNSRTGQY